MSSVASSLIAAAPKAREARSAPAAKCELTSMLRRGALGSRHGGLRL